MTPPKESQVVSVMWLIWVCTGIAVGIPALFWYRDDAPWLWTLLIPLFVGVGLLLFGQFSVIHHQWRQGEK